MSDQRGFINIMLLVASLLGMLLGHVLRPDPWDRTLQASRKYERWGSCMIVSDDRYLKEEELKSESDSAKQAEIQAVLEAENQVVAACREKGLYL